MSIARLPTPPVAPVTRISPLEGQCGGESSRTQRHRLKLIETFRERNDVLAFDACEFGIAAVIRFGKPATGHQDLLTLLECRIARRLDLSRKIDPTDEREFAQDFSGAGRSEGVFVVDRRVTNANHDFTRGQRVEFNGLELWGDFAALLMNAKCAKRSHERLALFADQWHLLYFVTTSVVQSAF
jgi:hypothetical protein